MFAAQRDFDFLVLMHDEPLYRSAERVNRRPAFRAGWQALPRLRQTIRRKCAACAPPSCLGYPLQMLIPSCGVLAVSSLAAFDVRSLRSAHPGRSRRRLASASSSDRQNTALFLRRGSVMKHLRSLLLRLTTRNSICVPGTMSCRPEEDGRIGYWYTNSLFARGASARRSLWGHPMSSDNFR